MDGKPNRRWFRFKLSTVLILTAIAAWGMATRPYVVNVASGTAIVGIDGAFAGSRGIAPFNTGSFASPPDSELNPRLLLPALALAAFLAWKAARAVVQRRRAGPA